MQTELVEGCRKGNPKAQEALYKQYAGIMLGVCIRYISDRSTAESVMVKGFMQVFNRIGQYSELGNFEGWMRRIMINESLMYLRKMKGFTNEIALQDLHYEPSSTYVESEMVAQDLLNLVHQLPEGYRAVFNLYAIEGYSHKEIAEMLSISVGTSKSQLSKARQFLRQKIKKMDQIGAHVA